MAHKIIALVDRSIYSQSVCEHAAWLAERTGCSVELMHVLGRREAGKDGDLSGAIALGARTALLEELATLDEQRARLAISHGRALLEDARAVFGDTALEISEHLRHGDLMEAVAEKEAEADLVLIGKRGEGADFARGHLGSNLERVLRAATRPVFIASRAFKPIHSVLIAFDGSKSATRAVEFVAQSPLYDGLSLSLVSAGEAGSDLKQQQAAACARLEQAGRTVIAETIPGDPETVIAALIAQRGIGHLVMGASGHSRLRTLFVGSTSLEMIRTCKVPILLVR